jgi:hypothetical protein
MAAGRVPSAARPDISVAGAGARARLPRARGPEALRAHSDEVVGVGGLQVLRHLPHPALRARRTVLLFSCSPARRSRMKPSTWASASCRRERPVLATLSHSARAAPRPLSSLASSMLQRAWSLGLPYQQHPAQDPPTAITSCYDHDCVVGREMGPEQWRAGVRCRQRRAATQGRPGARRRRRQRWRGRRRARPPAGALPWRGRAPGAHRQRVGAADVAGGLQRDPLALRRQDLREAIAARLVDQVPAEQRRVVLVPPACGRVAACQRLGVP